MSCRQFTDPDTSERQTGICIDNLRESNMSSNRTMPTLTGKNHNEETRHQLTPLLQSFLLSLFIAIKHVLILWKLLIKYPADVNLDECTALHILLAATQLKL